LYKCKNKGQTSCKKSAIADRYKEEADEKTEGKDQKNKVKLDIKTVKIVNELT